MIYIWIVKKLFLIFLTSLLFGCVNKKNNVETDFEKSVFSKEELKILKPHFENDTTVKKIQTIKIQTH